MSDHFKINQRYSNILNKAHVFEVNLELFIPCRLEFNPKQLLPCRSDPHDKVRRRKNITGLKVQTLSLARATN